MLNLSRNISFAHKCHRDVLYKIKLEFSLFPLIKALLFEATVSERRAKPFSPSLDSLLFDLRMTSIIIIMKLGRDSESIALYRTFHNQARASERASQRHRIRVVRGESKSLPPFARSFIRSCIKSRSYRATVFSRNRSSEKLVCLGKSEIGETVARR